MPEATGHQEQLLPALKSAFIDCLPVLYMLAFYAGLWLSHGLKVICRVLAVDSQVLSGSPAAFWGPAL